MIKKKKSLIHHMLTWQSIRSLKGWKMSVGFYTNCLRWLNLIPDTWSVFLSGHGHPVVTCSEPLTHPFPPHTHSCQFPLVKHNTHVRDSWHHLSLGMAFLFVICKKLGGLFSIKFQSWPHWNHPLQSFPNSLTSKQNQRLLFIFRRWDWGF